MINSVQQKKQKKETWNVLGSIGRILKILVAFSLLVSIIISAKLLYYIYKPEPVFKQIRMENGREMINASLNSKDVDYRITKTMQITHLDGTPIPLHITQFDCCGLAGMVKNKELFLGYSNQVEGKPLFSTTTQMVPVIEIEMVIHELMHIVSLHHATNTPITDGKLQEEMAYDIQWLYLQIRSFEEDGYIRLKK